MPSPRKPQTLAANQNAHSTPSDASPALQEALTSRSLTETDALKEFNAWRVSRNLMPIIPRGSSIARRGRSLYLSDEAHQGLQALSSMYTGRPNVSSLCEMLGLGILHIQEEPTE